MFKHHYIAQKIERAANFSIALGETTLVSGSEYCERPFRFWQVSDRLDQLAPDAKAKLFRALGTYPRRASPNQRSTELVYDRLVADPLYGFLRGVLVLKGAQFVSGPIFMHLGQGIEFEIANATRSGRYQRELCALNPEGGALLPEACDEVLMAELFNGFCGQSKVVAKTPIGFALFEGANFLGQPLACSVWDATGIGSARLGTVSAQVYSEAVVQGLGCMHAHGFTHPALHAGNLGYSADGRLVVHDLGHTKHNTWHGLTDRQFQSERKLDIDYVISKLGQYSLEQKARAALINKLLADLGLLERPKIDWGSIPFGQNQQPKILVAEILEALSRNKHYWGGMNSAQDRLDRLKIIAAHASLKPDQAAQFQSFLIYFEGVAANNPNGATQRILDIYDFSALDSDLQAILLSVLSPDRNSNPEI